MTGITAVVLTAGDYRRRWSGIDVLVRRQQIRNPAELLHARFEALADVITPYFFYLDDDDDLPSDHLEVLCACLAQKAPIVYTDELIELPDGQGHVTHHGAYSRAKHYENPQMLHHLVLCDTEAARESVSRLPRGQYCPELLLYWDMARQGAAYVPRIGYIWNKRPEGMHKWPATAISQVRTKVYNGGGWHAKYA